MNNLTRIFFYTFAVASFYSCEPEDIPVNSSSTTTLVDGFEPIGETGDDYDEMYNKEDHKNDE